MATRPVTIVLPWDLDPTLAAFPRTPRDGTLVVLESRAKLRALPWHRQKLTLVVSALRHFTAERRAAGFEVDHRVVDDYATGIAEIARTTKAPLHVMAPREHAIDTRVRALTATIPLTIHDDGGTGGHFLIPRDDFLTWTRGRKLVRMDQFYARMRQDLGLLVDAKGKPEGGRWSFDAENRGHARGVTPPPIPWIQPDELTRDVMAWVAQRDGLWGELEPFGWPVTRADALAWLRHFVDTRLADFGRYEDAIRSDQRFLFHSLLSVPLNLGLLRPDELARAAADAYADGKVPLASAEGFIRQVIGWREYMRGVYWWQMPGLRAANQLDARIPLPDFFWEPSRARLQCVREAVQSVHDTGYTHHIERLMVLCNYATLAGIDPRAVSHWFWAGFVDAYEWVELPNVVGMGCFGTDAFTTKPYVGAAAYVKRQSGLSAKGRGPASARAEGPCARCEYDPDQRTGPTACPLNAMYWDFMDHHRARWDQNPRTRQVLATIDRFGPKVMDEIRATAAAHRRSLAPLTPPWAFGEESG